MKADFETDAFSTLYDEYEKLSAGNFIDQSRRATIRGHVEKYLKPSSNMLELNAGSGIDALYFAQKGHRVLATDSSKAAAKYTSAKAKNANLHNLRFEHCDFAGLSHLGNEKFDYIFSNFGGLNCTGAPENIFGEFSRLLSAGGFATLVLMPKYYPWEMLSVFKGNKNAFRRFRKNAIANVGQQSVAVFYYSPADVARAFPKDFTHVATQNVGTFYPSAHFESTRRFENSIRRLVKLDNVLNRWRLMPKGVGDYFIITFQKTG